MSRLFPPATALAILTLATPGVAQDAARFAPSGRATTSIEIALPEGAEGPVRAVTLEWGQPHLRGRTLHTGSLVPFGEVWRTGANAPTALETDLGLMIGSAHLAPGRYLVFTLPTAAGWQLILQPDAGQTIATYDATQDLARLPLRARTLTSPVESLSMALIPAPEGLAAEWRISWGTTELAIDLHAMQ
ncbi:MAG TPA: DUF2911 domain-containing protein [Gemmatimonadales bacterium]|nr:DUF2911 domain-containing protein [Gemmatimonadales bacterium]HRX19049.1 DUF2911 domain-containing protein [Gemmatimonadales bacterium]